MRCVFLQVLVIINLAILFMLLSFPALAGDFKIMPGKLFLDPQKKTAVFKIISNDKERLAFQLNAVRWTQDEDGRDQYEPTKEIAFFPKILTIEKGEERMIRVGCQSRELPDAEKTYRLFVRELPVSESGGANLKMTMNIGVPVFVTPAHKTQKGVIEKAEISGGELRVRVRNSGNSHFIVQKISVIGSDAAGDEVFTKNINGWYVLPGVSKTFPVELSYKECRQSRVAEIAVQTEDSEMKAKLALNETICTQ
ncbi:MAG: hypothetical protein DRI57_24310 [Deltaproteobacteria bacterium]|nr:MAG: hypothetical protein DRI57_24310 [Deltaproteobacteria bacterium]